MIEAILNRLRGTGVIKHFGTLNVGNKKVEIKLVWNHIYALYLATLLGFFTASPLVGFAIFVAYLIGESKGWGEWVGALTTDKIKDEKWLNAQYLDNEGKGFPYIHQSTNYFVPEQIEGTHEEKLTQYNKYATLALSLRGFFWWGLVYGTLACFSIISIPLALAISVALGLAFPLACYIGKHIKFTKRFGILSFSQGWENQEVIYGLFQGIALWLVIFLI